jgi:lipoprotein-anchoring transpeptidase ErfK/SrfK
VRVRRLRATVVAAAMSIGVLGAVAVGQAQAGPDLTAGTPCAIGGDGACVSVDTKQAWLVDDGEVVRGPVQISVGAPGHETPRGSFVVEWKHKDHRSKEFNDAPMPWAVFFAPGGIAFHEGNLGTPSAGCVRLGAADAQAFYEFLEVGDPVEVR